MTTTSSESYDITLNQSGYDAWVNVTIKRQHTDGFIKLVSVEWKHWVRSYNVGARKMYGPSGETYWFPTRVDKYGYTTPGHVYSRHVSGFNSYGLDFESFDVFTPDDLLNLASASWDAMFWPYGVDSTKTNPFRPFEL